MPQIQIKLTEIQQTSQRLSTILADIHDQFNAHDTSSLCLQGHLTDATLTELSSWINTLAIASISQLSLDLPQTLIIHPSFAQFLQTLKNNPPQALVLSFSADAFESTFEDLLITHIASLADFPVIIKEETRRERPSFPRFEAMMIQAIQNAKQPPARASISSTMVYPETYDPTTAPRIKLKALIHDAASEYRDYVQVDVQHMEVLEQSTEQVVEVAIIAEQAIAQYEGELIDYSKFNSYRYHQIAERSPFYAEQCRIAFAAAQTELFANLPHAIKYLSPAAAEKLAEHLPQLVAINKENCIHLGFILKQTRSQEYVLDFDPYAEKEDETTRKHFAPQEYAPYEDAWPYYHINPTALSHLLSSVHSSDIRAHIQHTKFVPLMNLWIRHSDQGVQIFFKWLHNLDSIHPGLSVFIYTHHLAHFDHLEPFYHAEFFTCLDKLKYYSSLQIRCLKRFLQRTGSSRYHLAQTLEEFDYFWIKVTDLCPQHPEWLELLDCDWTTPDTGQPVVYMERLLTILSKARDVYDQLQCLPGIHLDAYGAYYASQYEGFTGVHPRMNLIYHPELVHAHRFNPGFLLYSTSLQKLLKLVQTASTIIKKDISIAEWNDHTRTPPGYTGFVIDSQSERLSETEFATLQSQGRALTYVEYAMTHEHLPRSYGLYKQTVHERQKGSKVFYYDGYHRIHASLPPSVKTFYPLLYRFIGQQLSGITLHAFITAFDHYKTQKSQYQERAFLQNEANYAIPMNLVTALFFMTHERYTGIIKQYINRNQYQDHAPRDANTFELLLENTECIIRENMIAKQTYLIELYEQHIKFSDLEAIYYNDIQRFFGTEELGIERTQLSADEYYHQKLTRDYPSRLHIRLLQNKYAAFKFIRFLGKQPQRIVSTYAFNTEDYFAQDSRVADTFREDLLMFSALLNNYRLNLTQQDFWSKMATDNPDQDSLQAILQYLQYATTPPQATNALYYTFKLIVASENYLTYQHVLNLFQEVSQLEQVAGKLDTHQIHQRCEKYGIHAQMTLPEMFSYDHHEIKHCLITLILIHEAATKHEVATLMANPQLLAESDPTRHRDLKTKDIHALQEKLQEGMLSSGPLIAQIAPHLLKQTLRGLQIQLIKERFQDKDTSPFLSTFAEYTIHLSDLQDTENFEAIERTVTTANAIAIRCKAICKQSGFKREEENFLALFANIQFQYLDSDLVLQWLDLLSKMPQRDYLPLLQALLHENPNWMRHQKPYFLNLLALLSKLHHQQFSTQAMIDFCRRFREFSSEDLSNLTTLNLFIDQWHVVYSEDGADPLLHFLLTEPQLNYTEMLQINSDTYRFPSLHRRKLANLYVHIKQKQQLTAFILCIAPLEPEPKSMLILILAKAYDMKRTHDPEVDIISIAQRLQALPSEQLTALHQLYETTSIRISSLDHALQQFNPAESFDIFLQNIEKSPFGKRDLAAQFDCSQVERVVNSSSDLINRSSYPYAYRKSWMEMFLVVNAIGHQWPIFHGKPAHLLSNIEIQNYFQFLKYHAEQDNITHQLCALALMREAMYRSTEQFPNSTQMLLLIDCILHPGHVISNFDTGQGKSLVDIMKCAYLWLFSDRVDMITSSIGDAKRDIENYAPFLKALGIPFASKPIVATTSSDEFCKPGINFSTGAQLALFYSKALVHHELERLTLPRAKLSLVINESDFFLLDDQTAYRFATTAGTTKSTEWIYTAINDYVTMDAFKRCDTSMETDIQRLKVFLRERARLLDKSTKILQRYDDQQLLKWLNSAILVNYSLRENYDYVLIENPPRSGHYLIKLLMSDKKVSPDSIFGHGIQPLLQAKINKEKRQADQIEDPCHIDPETSIIVSKSNCSLLDYYRHRTQPGFIWGSSGTVGSHEEIQEQYHHYGFDFSKIEPHHTRRVITTPPVILPNKQQQYLYLQNAVKEKRRLNNRAPTLIFCATIDEAKAIYTHLQSTTSDAHLQLNTGIEDEQTVIKQAATLGMITITTAAIGRNTDIPYDRTIGLDIWHTYVASTRLDGQKNGRTGRQGSKGSIQYILNADDQQIKTVADIERIHQQTDAIAQQKRAFNEEFYRILGHFLAHLEQLPADHFTNMDKSTFLQNKWGPFSARLEQQYRELKLAGHYHRPSFVATATGTYQQLLHEIVPDDVSQIPPLQEILYPAKASYHPNTQLVRMEECTTPIMTIYQLFHDTLAENMPSDEGTSTSITSALETLFSTAHATPSLTIKTACQFMQSIASIPTINRTMLKHCYQSFLNHFFQQLILKKETHWFFMRWLGYTNDVHQVLDHPAYLSLFRALATVDKTRPIVGMPMLKDMMILTIAEYLQNNWFISTQKKKAALDLQQAIRQAVTPDAIMQVLINAQLTVAQQDIAQSKKRYFFSVNFFGTSRLQNTLSRTIALAVSLGINNQTPTLIRGLTDQLCTILPPELQNPDDMKDFTEWSSATDTSNAQVIKTCLENAIHCPRI